jgi:nitrogen fixation protein NifB
MSDTSFIDLLAAPRVNALNRYDQGGSPTVSRESLTPMQAIGYLDNTVVDSKAPLGIHIGGPGDPLATPEDLFTLLKAIRERYADVEVWLTTAGLGLAEHVPALKELGLTRVNLRINAVDPETVAKVYAWVRPGKRTLPRGEGYALLVADQVEALRALKDAGVEACVETMVIPGVNSFQVADIARMAAEQGVKGLALTPYKPGPEPEDPDVPAADAAFMERIADEAREHIEIVDNCHGGSGLGASLRNVEKPRQALADTLDKTRPYVAVATTDGEEIDQHLGHADKLLVYGTQHGPIALVEAREAPPKGGGDARWKELSNTLSDCRALLAKSAGEKPSTILSGEGVVVLERAGSIEAALYPVFGMEPPKKGKGK